MSCSAALLSYVSDLAILDPPSFGKPDTCTLRLRRTGGRATGKRPLQAGDMYEQYGSCNTPLSTDSEFDAFADVHGASRQTLASIVRPATTGNVCPIS